MPLLTASKLAVSYGDFDLFSDVALEVGERARTGLVGPNGGGKTSLLKVLVGEQEPNAGQVYRAGGVRVGYVPQVNRAVTSGTLRDEVMVAFEELLALERAVADAAVEVTRSGGDAERRYAALLSRYEAVGGYDYESSMQRVAAGVGLDARTLDNSAATASGGELTRAALARALLSDPDLLVLDEPTNYLDFKGLAWLEDFLRNTRHAFVVVSHDRYFLDAVATQIWDLERGRLRSYAGNYTRYRELKAEQLVQQAREFERQQEYIAREQSFITRYRAGQRSKEARGRETRLRRLELVDAPPPDPQSIRVARSATARTPRVVASARDLTVGVTVDGAPVELASTPELTLERGSRTAIIGENGAGKTTLLRTLLGERPPMRGSVTLGDRVRVGYHRQGSDDLPDRGAVLEAMQAIRNIPPEEERKYLARFLFHGDDVFKDMSALSGGERTRLAIARLMAMAPSFLVLDEPTTHLDIPSREALESALADYDGTLLFVSHDRHLISLLARQLVIVEDGAATLFPGVFDEWARQSGLAPQRAAPRRDRDEPGRRRGVGTPRKKPRGAPKRGPKQEPEPDHEQKIANLEERLKRVEAELQAATERRNVAEITRLGKEYDNARAALEHAWAAWKT